MSVDWFTVDKAGLAQLVETYGKHRLVMELIANSWDAPGTTRVDVELRPVADRALVEVTVTDDSPDGFRDLAHAWTLFAPSDKKGNAEQRGRFNLGEKLVLALCSRARIVSTTGGVTFDVEGRTRHSRMTREKGTSFTGLMRMSRAELGTTLEELRRLLPPRGIATTVTAFDTGGEIVSHYMLEPSEPFTTFEASLQTVLADAEGYLRPADRTTSVELFGSELESFSSEGPMRPREHVNGWIYEMGIPVVEIGGPWHINVLQKVPLNKDRDNVPPAYLTKLRAYALDYGHQDLNPAEANAAWVSKALETAAPDTVSCVLTQRFGEKRVSYDPSDPEANKRAASEGYTVVTGGALSGDAWANVRAAGAIKPAGQVMPTEHPRFSPDGVDTEVPRTEWTRAQVAACDSLKTMGEALLTGRCGLSLRIVRDPVNRFSAWYGKGGFLTINLNVVGHAWFERGEHGLAAEHLDLLLHELGHEWCGDHLAAEYHEALTRLGALLAVVLVHNQWLRKLIRRGTPE